MNCYLLIDFGSTYTKLTLVDIDNEEILITSKDITTVESDIMIGFNKAFEKINDYIIKNNCNIVKKLACSSAAGGLKMVAIGLVPELTAEAAKRAALGAGAKVDKVYAFELTTREIEEIRSKNIDIILLAGGTDGGNKKCIIHNAKMIAEGKLNVPIVIAGNKSAYDELLDIFKNSDTVFSITENVMPKINQLNADPAREEIRKVFMEKIIEAKGLKNAENFINGILMPTPASVLNAARAFSEGSDSEYGIGDLIVIDVGGATTDIHSISKGEPTNASVNLRGLEEPFAKRTVEGDLGMRYSAHSLFLASGTKKVKEYLKYKDVNVEEKCLYRENNIMMVPENDEERDFDEAIGKVAVDISMERHAGHIECIHMPTGPIYSQYGKDLMDVKYLIGTGGVMVYGKNPRDIMSAGLFSEENAISLKPKKPQFLIDKDYILSAMGLLCEDHKDMAVRIMKKHITKI